MDSASDKVDRYTKWLQEWVSYLPEGIGVENRPDHLGRPYRWEVYRGESGQPAKSIGFLDPATVFVGMSGEEAREFLYTSLRNFVMARGIDHTKLGPKTRHG